MRLKPLLAALGVLAVALPFLFSFTAPPVANFWPLMVSWLCGAVLVVLWSLPYASFGSARARWSLPGTARTQAASLIATALLLAALFSAVIGLVQYFNGAQGFAPWVAPSVPGQAIGNLRQRNQLASLLSMGVLALLWLLARMQALRVGSVLWVGRRVWPAGLLTAWALALLAVGSAATASRTGMAQWLLIVGLLALWRVSLGRQMLGLAVVGVLVYALAAWWLPGLLAQSTGVAAEGLFGRLADASGCSSRRVLWSNVLYLIAQKPWLGWGWGELDYAHYITLFPGERFCVLLDNAHNLPLHLAVELGVPVAALACTAVLAWVWRARPWRESDPARQLAWGILAIVGLHSMVEFPLWYGPFQLVTVLAVLLLWRGCDEGAAPKPRLISGSFLEVVLSAKGLAATLSIALMGYAAWDYDRVSQVFRPVAQRAPAYRENALVKVSDSCLFADVVDFALLTTTPVTRETAPQMHVLATQLLHYSPEPRVIEPLIESAALLGLDNEVAFHLHRYRVAYPQEYARWSRMNRAFKGAP